MNYSIIYYHIALVTKLKSLIIVSKYTCKCECKSNNYECVLVHVSLVGASADWVQCYDDMLISGFHLIVPSSKDYFFRRACIAARRPGDPITPPPTTDSQSDTAQ